MPTTITTQDEDRWITRFLPERYTLQVGPSTFALSFVPVMFFESYNEEQLHALTTSSTWEVIFADETPTPGGRLVAQYGLTGKGNAFRVLGSAAHGILTWAREKQPDYLSWWTLEPRKAAVSAKIIRYFVARGSGWQRLDHDPFTGHPCRPEAFWLYRVSRVGKL